METERLEKTDLQRCAALLREQKTVVFPTDTVFGVAALITPLGFSHLVEAKHRPENKPFPIMVSSLAQIQTLAQLSARDLYLIQRWMPGAVTFIFRKRDEVADYVTNHLDTIGIRMPEDPWILALIDEVGSPLFVPSANQSGEATSSSYEAAFQQMNGRVSAIVAGECLGKVSSTIIDCTQEKLRLIRQGELKLEDIEEDYENSVSV